MKIVHAADLHIDSPLKGLEHYETAPVERARDATRKAFANIIDLCLEQRADLLLIAGDIFDSDWRDYHTGLFFVAQLSRLMEVGTRVFLVRGNHDCRNEVTRSLRWPRHVHEMSARAAETVLLEDLGVAVHGRSYPQRSVEENLVPDYPEPRPGLLNIGLLHANVHGVPGHDNYAPCSRDDLVAKGYGYWALGHVHQHLTLNEFPHIVYPGCSQGRSIREPGPKGCVLVTASAGEIESVEFTECGVMRWESVEVPLGEEARTVDDALDLCEEAVRRVADRATTPLALRFTIAGASEAHASLAQDRDRVVARIRQIPIDLGIDAWIEKVVVATRCPPDLSEADGLIARTRARLRELAAGGDLEPLMASLRVLDKAAGAELRDAGLDLTGPAAVRALLPQVEGVLLASLMGGLS